MSPRSGRLVRHLTLGLACGLALTLAPGCGRESDAMAADESDQRPATLDVPADHAYAGPSLAQFELVECRGETVTLEDLRGRPAVLEFMFTTCAGPCPAMTANMSLLQAELAGTDVRLVSISVDPDTDTPEVLRAYSDAYGADPERWWFLTGSEEQMAALAASVYLSVVPDDTPDALVGYQVAHSTKFVVVDAEGVVRGYYDGRSAEGVPGTAARARYLAGEH